ncbi:aspartyl/asparaginyl beta-hydroxylase [Ferrovibrio sp.]|uniref:aspartyl/asparaginyl beta-hydroxylase n=1 Tax=Ferrovibrio sp. TaxID=1917215 RepID=UPI001B7947D1|nr:aspartyl/asparaginyl beta-hydroxylase [Ferrovibrio sp.]MBP7062926.1 aspartyl/asparaginyl beta-hydroxylase [Ferrovibrio sp.]
MTEVAPALMPVRAVPSGQGGDFVLRPIAGPADFLFGLHGRPPAGDPAAAGLQTLPIRAFQPGRPALPPLLSIWHLTRCGSTLTARMLACLQALQVTDEPGALVDICGAFWSLVPDAERLAALDKTLLALGQPLHHAARHLVVKQSLRAGLEPDLFTRLHPGMQRLLLIRDPLEILVSNLRGKPGWLHLRHMAWSPLLSGLALDRQSRLSDAEFIAHCLGRAFSILADRVAQNPAGWLILDYAELPDAIITRLLPRLGITPGPDELAAMAEVTKLQAWNRAGRLPFSDDRAEKQAAASPEIRALCDQFLRPPWHRLAALHAGQLG